MLLQNTFLSHYFSIVIHTRLFYGTFNLKVRLESFFHIVFTFLSLVLPTFLAKNIGSTFNVHLARQRSSMTSLKSKLFRTECQTCFNLRLYSLKTTLHVSSLLYDGFSDLSSCRLLNMYCNCTTLSILFVNIGSRCGRVMADNIAYAKFRKSLLIW